ncbi:MAG TPA: DUF4325 domain-containing protein [Longimicrobium sp.]|nr:DUF4325 domain-containing protein [Longimicrobium sp.]
MAISKPVQVRTARNRLSVGGSIGLLDFRRVLAGIHKLTARTGDVVLDFSACEAASPGPMLTICADATRLRKQGHRFELLLPSAPTLAARFRNSGWAYFLDPQSYPPSRSRSVTQVPLIQFSTPHEQQDAVNRMIDAILSSVTTLGRGDLAAIEWSLNEITDNVLVHATSEVGGFVQLTNSASKRRVEFSVADAGVGIPQTLREGHPEIASDSEALERAIMEGVTRSFSIGQGNGLFGTFKVAQVSNGAFHIHSSYARLDYDSDQVRIRSEAIPYRGTLVVASMDYSNPAALGEALRFGGKRYEPTDYIEHRYEHDTRDDLIIRLKDEARSFGSRVAGQPIRNKLRNLIRMNPGHRVVLDFAGIPLVSSSFADEVVAKLFVELGPMAFINVIELRNVSETVQALIDRAIVQRGRTGIG